MKRPIKIHNKLFKSILPKPAPPTTTQSKHNETNPTKDTIITTELVTPIAQKTQTSQKEIYTLPNLSNPKVQKQHRTSQSLISHPNHFDTTSTTPSHNHGNPSTTATATTPLQPLVPPQSHQTLHVLIKTPTISPQPLHAKTTTTLLYQLTIHSTISVTTPPQQPSQQPPQQPSQQPPQQPSQKPPQQPQPLT